MWAQVFPVRLFLRHNSTGHDVAFAFITVQYCKSLNNSAFIYCERWNNVVLKSAFLLHRRHLDPDEADVSSTSFFNFHQKKKNEKAHMNLKSNARLKTCLCLFELFGFRKQC